MQGEGAKERMRGPRLLAVSSLLLLLLLDVAGELLEVDDVLLHV